MSTRLTLTILAILALLATACGTSAQEHPTATPTSPTTEPRPTATERPAEVPRLRGEDAALVGAIDWTHRNHSMLADALVQLTIPAAPFLESSDANQIKEHATVEVKFPTPTGDTVNHFIVPAEVSSTFRVDKPVIGGTYKATLPISITVDIKLPMEERATSYHIPTSEFSLEKQ